MDRVQPSNEIVLAVKAFTELPENANLICIQKESSPKPKPDVRIQLETEKPKAEDDDRSENIDVDEDLDYEYETDISIQMSPIISKSPSPLPVIQATPSIPIKPPRTRPPKIVITKTIENGEKIPIENERLPLQDFENLDGVLKLIMSFTGKSTCKIFTSNGLNVYKCHFPQSTYWEGCKPDQLIKNTEVCEYRTSNLVMQLRYQTPPCHSCFEEETNSIEILGPDDKLIGTIIQKKTWNNTKISRDIIIKPGPYGKADMYKAHFTWNDSSVNFKATRNGLMVATLITDCQEKGYESNYVLQFLRDVRPRDKAMLIGFMVARDSLMSDETQTKIVVERISLILIVTVFFIIFVYLFLPSSRG